MNKVIGVFLLMFCVTFVSAGFFDGIVGKITGNVVMDGVEFEFSDISCSQFKEVFDEEYYGYVVPKAIPFSNDMFEVYVDEKFFASFELVEKKVESVGCEISEDATYRVYVSEGLVQELVDGLEVDPVSFYNKKKASGDLKIKAVGFVRKIKLGVINLGIKVADWFN